MTGETLTSFYADGSGHLGQANMSESQTKKACNGLKNEIGGYMEEIGVFTVSSTDT